MKNVRERFLFGVLPAVLILLSACSGGFTAGKYDFDVALDPGPLGYEVDDQGGITVPSHILTFNSTAGSVGATIEGYHVEYLDSSGSNLFPGDSVQYSEGSLNVRVPPGIQCPEFDTAPVIENCTVNTTGVIFARGESASSASTALLPGNIARQHLALYQTGGAVGATANVTFYGTDDLQRRFVSEPFQFAIIVPLGN